MAITTSILTGGINNHQTTSEEANGLATDFVGQGIVGSVGNTSGVAPNTGGFAVNAQGTPDTTVAISSGVAYVTGTPTSQNSQVFRVKNSASTNLTISANVSGSTKYDWIYIKLDATKLNGPNTAGDDVATIVASRSSSASSDDGTPPTYGYAIAVVTVANSFTTITNANIRDVRTQVALNTGTSNSVTGWTAISTSLSTSTGYNKGNKEYDITTASSLTSVLSEGMRLKFTRGVTAPTQCTSLNGSSQYWTKTTPSGITFTDDFIAGGWIKPSSYANGTILSRFNGTSGWQLWMDSSGRIILSGYNASGSNFSQVTSYQSVPLNKWTHVAASLDMSGFSTTNSKVLINGTDVPALVSRGGTNPTALVQAGDLNIGAYNNATNFFPGKISEVFLYSANISTVSATTLRDRMNSQLVGNESNLAGYWKLDGNANDSTANANNFSAGSGAAATNSDNPMNATEYAIVTKVTASTVTVFTGTDYNVPNITLSTPYYSTHKSPFGFPAEAGKWTVSTLLKSQIATTINNTTAQLTGAQISLPTGAWKLGHRGYYLNTHAGATFLQAVVGLSTSTSAFTDDLQLTRGATPSASSSLAENDGYINAYISSYAVTSQTSIYLLGKTTANQTVYYAPSIPGAIEAECTYL